MRDLESLKSKLPLDRLRAFLDPTFGRTHDDELRKRYLRLFDDLKASMAVYERHFDFSCYYESLKDLTIESRVFQLKHQEALDLLYQGSLTENSEAEITEAIEKLGGEVFVKMRRSPKDSPLCHDGFMIVSNCSDLKELCQTSERLKEDMSNELILRRFVPNLGWEFRCFLCKSQLNAVTLQPNQAEFTKYKEFEQFVNSE